MPLRHLSRSPSLVCRVWRLCVVGSVSLASSCLQPYAKNRARVAYLRYLVSGIIAARRSLLFATVPSFMACGKKKLFSCTLTWRRLVSCVCRLQVHKSETVMNDLNPLWKPQEASVQVRDSSFLVGEKQVAPFQGIRVTF